MRTVRARDRGCENPVLMRPGEPPAPVTLPLLCALGHHKTDGLARWNAGYYFARCTRCRRDLVRTAFTRWQIPRGFRVVWQGESNGMPGPTAEIVAHSGSAATVEFPIREDAQPVAAANGDIASAERADEPLFAFDAVPTGGEDRAIDDEALRDAEGSDPREMSVAPVPSWFDGENRFEEGTRFAPDDRLVEFETAVEPPTYVPGVDPADGAARDGLLRNGDASKAADEDARDGAASGEDEAVAEDGRPVAALFVDDGAAEDVAIDEREPDVPPPASSKYPVVPDFMDESANGVGWDVVSGRIIPVAGLVAPAVPPPDDARGNTSAGAPGPAWQDLARKRAQGAGEQGRGWLRGIRASRTRAPAPPPVVDIAQEPSEKPVAVATTPVAEPIRDVGPRITVADASPPGQASQVAPDAPAAPVQAAHVTRVASARAAPAIRGRRLEAFLMNGGPIAAAAIFGGLVLAAALVDGRNSEQRVVYRPAPAASSTRTAASPTVRPSVPARRLAVGGDATVTAGLLNCRSTASNNADTLRRIGRGATVQVLAITPGWVNVSHQGERCWVAEQHVRPASPA